MEGSTAAISSARFISSWATMAVKGKGGTLDQLPDRRGPGRGSRADAAIMHELPGANSRARLIRPLAQRPIVRVAQKIVPADTVSASGDSGSLHRPRQRLRTRPANSFSELWT